MPESAWLMTVQRGPHVGRAHALSGASVTIGRQDDNDITLDHPTVSRHHARLTWQGQAYRIEDLGTVNGTWVNGVRIDAPVLLRPGDTIGLGPEVVLSAVPAPAPRAPPAVVSAPPSASAPAARLS